MVPDPETPDPETPDQDNPDHYTEDEFVTVFESRGHSAEVEAETVHGLLESAGLEALIVRENVPTIPVGKVSVKVLASDKDDAEKLIEGARDAGRTASAAEASE